MYNEVAEKPVRYKGHPNWEELVYAELEVTVETTLNGFQEVHNLVEIQL